MINIFVADAEEPFYMSSKGNPLYVDFSTDNAFIRGQTYLGPHTWRDSDRGSHFYVDGGTGRAMQIATHEFMHTMGISHVAGSPGQAYVITDSRDDSAIAYSALSHPTCETNAIGLWYCSEKYIVSSPPQCDESERCCGTRAETDPDNHMFDTVNNQCLADWPLPSAFTPTYAEVFTKIVEHYLHINGVVPATIDGPDGTCAGNWDEYSCYDQEGCEWENVFALCMDISGFPDYPAKPHMTISNKAKVNPQYGNTKTSSWDPLHNMHSYIAQVGEMVEFYTHHGYCTWNQCSRCER